MGQYFGQAAEAGLSRGASKKSVERSWSNVSSGVASEAEVEPRRSESNLSTKSDGDETKDKVIAWNKANIARYKPARRYLALGFHN
jgi:hypothetical protein